MENKINVYTCPNGHKTVTKDIDKGTTPFIIRCRMGCDEEAKSCFYCCDQTLIPGFEWYKPSAKEAAIYNRGMKQYIEMGGLVLRPVASSPEIEERMVDLDWIKANAKYYILDKNLGKSIAICWINPKTDLSSNQHRGYTFYQHRKGWEFNPTSCHDTILKSYYESSRYDLTKDFETAVKNAMAK